MLSLTVEHFSEQVPLVDANASAAEVLQTLVRSRANLAVVQDRQQQPVGVLSLSELLSCALPIHVQPGAIEPPTISKCVLEPIKLVPDHWSLERIYQATENAEACHWLLMDKSGGCQGVLDQTRWWAFWARQLLPDGEPLPPQFQPSIPVASTISTVSLPLLEPLLEHVPLPLMLLTGDGQVLSQNGIWRYQLARLQNPDEVWKKVAAFLMGEPPLMGASLDDADAPPVTESELTEPGTDSSWEMLLKYASGLHAAGTCQKIPNSSVCVCLCGMGESVDAHRDGQVERVWQFCGTFLGYMPQPGDPALNPTEITQTALGAEPPTPNAIPIWLILAQDVTEQHQVAKELAAKNADLVQLNRLKDEFLACISHELRTPLTAVLGLSNLLKDQVIGSLNERQARYARLIYQSGRHLMTIVNDILDLTRIETGQLELTMAPLAVEGVCLRALSQARQAHGADGLDEDSPEAKLRAHRSTFSLEIQPEVSTIVADELRLRQMLTNLLSNALKFTDDNGQVGLRVEEWDGWVAFTVWDTGIGIPQDQQSLIFQKFQQLEHPLTRQFEGTGLGLVLTQRLAWLHGGDVTFTSTQGQGSQFTLLLPPDPSLKGVKPRTLGTTWAGGTGHHLVLLVEVVPHYLDDLSQQLSQLGFRLAIARSGTEALKKARQLQPLMIFLNPLLPQLSGWDVLTLLRSHNETHQIPIVITSSRTERGKAFSHGASGFLTVPVQPEGLRQTVEGVLAQVGLEQPKDADKMLHLTILHLRPAIATVPDLPLAFAAHEGMTPADAEDAMPQPHPLPVLADLLQPHPCRVLEVDDLDQADLLARVWKPHLVLLDGVLPKPLTYLRNLNRHAALAALPLITLSPENTQAAHQMRELSVFPCLEPLKEKSQAQSLTKKGKGARSSRVSDRPDISSLLTVIRKATGS
ncbi:MULTISPECIES: ATP-binding protein [unclassified Leptolyngbya]|uniref:ATP-binding protein n=1 Tax=unclassified Leptolyngbya TaxID=2650499 RepID=UPI001685BF72|nr:MULTISPECIES: ATP-binding protein [unclassified Leptolyngbya]MBD1912594.1 response regulator [Leptolyngbya sp. FACHB-8]MBD2158504.1 response regulator [Leptolyngbya sp. FACHB-16]